MPPYATASKGCGIPRDVLHSAGAHANFAGNFVHAFTCAQLFLDALFNNATHLGH